MLRKKYNFMYIYYNIQEIGHLTKFYRNNCIDINNYLLSTQQNELWFRINVLILIFNELVILCIKICKKARMEFAHIFFLEFAWLLSSDDKITHI